ncbi:hypothetical protein [Clostridium sp. HBUAS56017]|uniref:hypothetical protein n=1 Tax=Clostridium sp. HBUAS56017 TaxID=2571128 RepID=UPI001178C058|nr:hypothetical protein [Clostridium sp. HBUAS56017]
MKKLFWGGIFLLAFVFIGFIINLSSYKISDDKKQLEISIMNFGNPEYSLSNISKGIEQDPQNDAYADIKQELKLDDKKFALYTLYKRIGFAALTKGLNNKYKIDFTERGSGYFRNRIIETNKGKYIILLGKNPDMKITYTNIQLDGKEYKIEIPQQEYYIVYCKVPNSTQVNFININKIKLFNENDVDITDEMIRVLIR